MNIQQIAEDGAAVATAAQALVKAVETSLQAVQTHNADPKAAPIDVSFLTIARGYAVTAANNIANHAKAVALPPAPPAAG